MSPKTSGPVLPPRMRVEPLIIFVLMVGPLEGVSFSAESGEELFAKQCAICHGKDGKAKTPAGRKFGAKDLSETKLLDVDIEKQINEGKKDDHGVQKMPPFKALLSDGQIKSLISVVKNFRK